MAVSTATVAGQILTSAYVNNNINSGHIAIVPTSVTNGSVIAGTASATANATVASITVNGVFSSTYDSYRVVISNLTMSSVAAGTNVFLKMHDGTNPSNTNYNYGIAIVDMTTGAVSGLFGAAVTTGLIVGRGTGDKFGTAFTVINPNLATHTIFPDLSTVAISAGYSGSGSGMHQASTSYTGFQLLPSTGTITGGTITVYGYRK